VAIIDGSPTLGMNGYICNGIVPCEIASPRFKPPSSKCFRPL
jgi:hypothetical protein